ncbi:hypothetical protein HK097_007003, partial [Rhizophlyctis rosea]
MPLKIRLLDLAIVKVDGNGTTVYVLTRVCVMIPIRFGIRRPSCVTAKQDMAGQMGSVATSNQAVGIQMLLGSPVRRAVTAKVVTNGLMSNLGHVCPRPLAATRILFRILPRRIVIVVPVLSGVAVAAFRGLSAEIPILFGIRMSVIVFAKADLPSALAELVNEIVVPRVDFGVGKRVNVPVHLDRGWTGNQDVAPGEIQIATRRATAKLTAHLMTCTSRTVDLERPGAFTIHLPPAAAVGQNARPA